MTAEQINPADDDRPKQAEPGQEEDFGPELDAETILAAKDRPMTRVAVPDWGGHVWIKTMGGLDRDQYDIYLSERVNPKTEKIEGCNWRANLLARCLCNSQGELLFTEEQIEALGEKSGKVLDEIFAIARQYNPVTKRDIDEIKKASAAARRGVSQPASAETSEDGGTPTSASPS